MIWQWLRRLFGPRQPSVEQLRGQFAEQRADLERRFFEAAASSGKPRGLRWRSVEFETAVLAVRDRQSGQALALVGITIGFEAVEGGDMEGLPAVGNLRLGSALFFHDGKAWQTAGRVLFNLGPEEVAERSSEQFERL